MRTYYYIPTAHEAMFASQVNSWLSAPNNWTIITGHYQNTEEAPDFDAVSLVVSRNYIGESITIPVFIQQDGQVKKLTGFVLEADLIAISPDLHAQLVSLPGVIESPDSAIFLNLLP